MRIWRLLTWVGGVLFGCLCFSACQAWSQGAGGLSNTFYAMNTGTRDARRQSAQEQVEMVKALGYEGISYDGSSKPWLDGLSEMIEASREADLALIEAYIELTLDSDTQTYDDPRVMEAIELLRGSQTMIFLALMNPGHVASSPTGDAVAVKVVGDIAERAGAAGLRVALYPHAGMWMESVKDANRIVEKVDRANVGICFNLCHTLMVDGEESVVGLARSAWPYLFAVTINGADADGKDWGTLIQPLDRGTYDVSALLQMLDAAGYRGPIGLQGYGIAGDVEDNLRRSMTAWQQYRATVLDK